MIYTLFALAPILLVIVMMLALNRPAKESMPAGWALTMIVAIFVWKQDIHTALSWAADGFLEAIGTMAVIAGAVAIMNVLKATGAMATIERMFTSITPDRRLQAVIIGFVFGAFLEGAAGFGTPAAIAAPLLIGLGFPSICAAIIALIFNSAPVNFGAVGVPTTTLVAVTQQAVEQAGVSVAAYTTAVTLWCAAINALEVFLVLFAGVFVLCRFFGGSRRLSDVLEVTPFLLLTGVSYAVFSLATAVLCGPEFPSLVGGILTLVVTVVAARRGFLVPKNVWEFEGERVKGEGEDEVKVKGEGEERNSTVHLHLTPSPLIAWLPYALVAGILVLTRLNVGGVKTLLTSSGFTVSLGALLGTAGVNWKWNWGWCPGVMPFAFVCVLTLFLHRCPWRKAVEAARQTGRQCLGAGLALFFGVSMVYLYRNTGMNAKVESSMLFVLAQSLADVFRTAYVGVAPLIGVLGAFMSGSNTVSNTLFSSLQYQTAVFVKLSPVLIVVLQNVGAAAGNMVCVNNVVAACATTGTSGREGEIIRKNFPVCVIYCLIAVVIVGTALWLGADPLALMEKTVQ